MRPSLAALLVGVTLLATCGGRAPTAPEPPPPPDTPPEVQRFSLSGRVTTTAGAPLAAADVEVVSGVNVGEKVTADADGRYEFAALLPGTMTVRASAAGHLPQSSNLTLGAAATADFTLATPSEPPPARVTISGAVCAQAPPPAPPRCLDGATVRVQTGPDAGRSTTTDASGHYSLADLAAGDITIEATATGYVGQARSMRLTTDDTVDFALPLEPYVMTGRVVDVLTEEGVGGITVSGEGITGTTSDGSGSFRLSVPVSSTEPRLLVLAGPGFVERRTRVRIPGADAIVSLISNGLDLPSFDEMFRLPMLRRWTSAPPLMIERRVVAFTDINMTEAEAIDRQMSDEEAAGLAADLEWALPQLTGTAFGRFDRVTQQTSAEAARVPLLVSGIIKVCRVEGLNAATGFWGYGRWQQTPDGTVTGGLVMLDRAFEESGNQFRRALRAHELGHALGYQHVSARLSVMNPAAREEPNAADRAASRIAFQRLPGNRSPDIDPDGATLNRHGRASWSAPIR